MVAERGPLVKAQLSHTHAFCSHAPDKNQKHTGWYLKKGLRGSISVKELPNNLSHLHQESPSHGNRKDSVKTLLGQILTKSAVAVRLDLSFKLLN